MDRLIARAKLPNDADAPSSTDTPPEPTDVINQAFLPVFAQAIHKERDTQAQNAMLLTKLALQAYRQQHRVYPSSLNELVRVGILKSVPTDPFATTVNTPLAFRPLEKDNYLLYSVGPDGKDNQGTPIRNLGNDGKQKRYTEPDTKGDFVLGVNLY